MRTNKHWKDVGLIAVALIAVVAIIFLIILYGNNTILAEKYETLNGELASTTATFQDRIKSSEDALAETREKNDELAKDLQAERLKSNVLQGRVTDIAKVANDLDKLRRTDPELLAKYSKVFFLNENYVPAKLDTIDEKYVTIPTKPLIFHSDVLPFLEDMLEAAKEDDVDIKIVSAFRSFETQASLKANYTVRYGTGANAFSADQGYSEHQLGTTLDLSSAEIGNGLVTGFDKTKAFSWLKEHAHEYGFTLSYPSGNAFYQYEPWHWRFVGISLASDLKDEAKYFYDLDQRKIDEYLITIFDD